MHWNKRIFTRARSAVSYNVAYQIVVTGLSLRNLSLFVWPQNVYSRSQGLSPEYSNISDTMTECLYSNSALISRHENSIYGHYITAGYLSLLICSISSNYFVNSTINISSPSWLVKRVIRYTGTKPKFCKLELQVGRENTTNHVTWCIWHIPSASPSRKLNPCRSNWQTKILATTQIHQRDLDSSLFFPATVPHL